MKINYIIPDNITTPIAVKTFLKNTCGFSQGLWRKLKWQGTLLVNDVPQRATTALASGGDRICCILPQENTLAKTPMKLDIRYEDEYMLILNKPAGILVHPTGGDYDNTLGNGLLHYYEKTCQALDFHPVHRLDRNTTGLVLVAKLPQLQNILTQAKHRERKFFHRSYLAIIEGKMPQREGIIDLPITRHPDSIIKRICSPEGQRAITHYKTLATKDNKSLLELTLETGRTHQIRVHLATLGHPILGDDLYGGKMDIISRQALHAYHLAVDNPLSGESLSIYAPLPMDMFNAFK